VYGGGAATKEGDGGAGAGFLYPNEGVAEGEREGGAATLSPPAVDPDATVDERLSVPCERWVCTIRAAVRQSYSRASKSHSQTETMRLIIPRFSMVA